MNRLLPVLSVLCVLLVPSPAQSPAAPELLIPLYDLSYAPRVLKLATTRKISIILNVADGPGVTPDKLWQKLIRQFPATTTPYAYVELVTWRGNKSTPRPLTDITRDCDRWKQIYGITRYFFDDYQTHTETRLPNAANSIANPGQPKATTCGITVAWETENYLKSKPSSIPTQAIFAMAQEDWRPAYNLATQRKIKLIFITPRPDNWHAYDKLPPYLEEIGK